MVLKNNRKGQAAIEFLMTYGWMLLVVLIVGALIFSFVDFGSLLPNKVDLNNNLRGDAENSVAYNKDSTTNSNQVLIVFKYTGSARTALLATNTELKTELGDTCSLLNITNIESNGVANGGANSKVPFLNGDIGIARFNCSSANANSGLLANDNLAGTVSIILSDPKTKIEKTSTGPVRLSIE